jgi:hypothetical protein
MHPHNFTFKVDVNVINHLGVGLYSSTPAALTELVANAWDADATKVQITVSPATHSITIEDDGHGMTAADIQNKFLNVGYSRRQSSAKGKLSDSGRRRVMGRKGIGKLSMFALADHLKISSKTKATQAVGFLVDVPKFKESLEKHKDHPLEEFAPAAFRSGHGTRIELADILKSLNTTVTYLRTKLARRFSVIGDEKSFAIELNGSPITKVDRNFYHAVQFLWGFDEPSVNEILPLCTSLAKLPADAKKEADKKPCIEFLPNAISFGDQVFYVRGYIASVEMPRQLGAKEDSANMVSIFANGRVFSEDVLQEANSAKYYQSYLVGEIHADFLDDDDVDRATASREAIKRDDPRYRSLLSFIQTALESIGNKWDDWRVDLGITVTEPQHAVIVEWINGLDDQRDKKAATKLMSAIKNAVVNSNEAKNESAKSVLYKGAIVGFEKLRIKKQLDRLDDITDVLGAEFASIFASLDDVEETTYAEITRQRLAVIKKFADIVRSPDTLEKVAQEYLANHLWLLDPTWDRVSGVATMELDLTEYLRKKFPDSVGARLDISYRKSTSRHVVVELKKPSITSLDFFDLQKQVSKYRDAVSEYYATKEPNQPNPVTEVYVLIAKTPTGYSEAKKRSMAELGGKIITYESLINDSKKAYEEYLAAKAKVGTLQELLDRLPS